MANLKVVWFPTANDKYWLSNVQGGISGKPLAWSGSALSNCVGMAWGNIMLNNNGEKPKFHNGVGNPPTAAYWISTANKYGVPTGAEPKIGGTLVYSGGPSGSGHVVSVIRKYKDGSVDIQGSDYGGSAVYFKHYTKENNYSCGAKFTYIGCVYNELVDDQVVEIPEPVDQNTRIKQVEIPSDTHNIRPEPNTSNMAYYNHATVGFYDVLDIYEGQDYVWCKIGGKGSYQYWIAVCGDVKVHEAETSDSASAELERVIEDFSTNTKATVKYLLDILAKVKDLEKLESKVEALEQQNKELQDKINTILDILK